MYSSLSGCIFTIILLGLNGLGLGPRGHGRDLQSPANKAGHEGDTGYGSSAQRSHDRIDSLQTQLTVTHDRDLYDRLASCVIHACSLVI